MRPGYGIGPHVGLVRHDGPPLKIFLADLRHGPVLLLAGSAAIILLVALELPTDRVAGEVAELTGADAEEIAPQVRSFLDELVGRGVVVEQG